MVQEAVPIKKERKKKKIGINSPFGWSKKPFLQKRKEKEKNRYKLTLRMVQEAVL